MLFVKVINWQNREQCQLPRVGRDSYLRWLLARGYDLVTTQPLGRSEFEIYQAESGIYAVYYPAFGTLNSECLFVNIPSENEVQMLVSNSQERLEPIREMFGL
jgi:hypothetical protein